jgi:2-haloacid dehalogenase
MPDRAFIFDVFGTLVDWRTGVADAARAAFALRGLDTDPQAFADAWRARYDPAMQQVRAGARGYVPLDTLHRENLDAVLDAFGIADAVDADARADLNRAWERLPAWPDVPGGLRRLRGTALVAPCSNGSVALMVRLARHADLCWDTVVGAETAQDYKPAPRVYLASCAALGLPPDRVTMVAAHNGDLHAARAAGLRTAFIARPREHGPGQTSDLGPDADWDRVVTRIGDLAA